MSEILYLEGTISGDQLYAMPRDILDHCGPLKTHAPAEHSHTFGQAHRFKHFRSEHPRLDNMSSTTHTCSLDRLTFAISTHLFKPSCQEKTSIDGYMASARRQRLSSRRSLRYTGCMQA